ncbi:hypothetical protein TRAPUB_13832 [Trametes pubescens]|uniref:Uncharacterized protein n=1 Tax=Trametes pubescens TaxID=154538 RepID=A0A1M2VQB7_TRAPU|nr:hypothetical protein TRAPUB_13832 [Trametes pubescens]
MSKIIESGENLPHPPSLTPDQRKLIAATVPILAETGPMFVTVATSEPHPEWIACMINDPFPMSPPCAAWDKAIERFQGPQDLR